MKYCLFILALMLSVGQAKAEKKEAAPAASGKKSPYGYAGCGLGSIVMGNEGGQISAATTNISFYSKMGGIISGTSNCEPDESGKTASRQEQFVGKNLATLSKEISQGKGETLHAYAETLGCDNGAYPEFASYLQKSHQQIFAAPGAVAVLETTKEQLQHNALLKKSCGQIG